jgi:hypothetical protein
MAAMAVSAFFISVAYHPVVWIFLGLVAAYYAAARTHDPSWEVTFTWRDLVFVSGFDVAIMIAMLVYLKIKAP